MAHPYKKNLPIGSKVRHRDGYIFIKVCEGEQAWKAYHRLIAEKKILGRPLQEGEKVYRKMPDRNNNNPDNLVVLKFRTRKFVKLPYSEVIYIPKKPGQIILT
jgi:hypothetical protein